MNKQISIIGCGWLGLHLAKHLMAQNYEVKGSTTHLDKIPVLKSVGIEAFYVELTEDKVKGDIESCLTGSSVLILNIPPGLRNHPESNFVGRMALLIPCIEKSSVKNIIFISSTSVYADLESIPVITEASIPNPETASGKQLLEVENMLRSNAHFKTSVLRFSGLFGPNRHPANHLSGKTDLKNPDAPVNLIHLEDCIEIIRLIIKKNCWNDTFNASTQPNPSKKDYYTFVCKKLNLTLPTFDTHGISKGKLINSQKLIQHLDYEFQVKLNN